MGDVDFRKFDNRCCLLGYLGPQQADPIIGRINDDDHVITWGARAWCICSGRDKHSIPHIVKKLILIAPDMSTVREGSSGALEVWGSLSQNTHHEQLNLGKFYEQAG